MVPFFLVWPAALLSEQRPRRATPNIPQLFLLKQASSNCGSHLQIDKDESERGDLRLTT